MAFTSSRVACSKGRFAVPLIKVPIRLADIHTKQAPDRRGKETWRLHVELLSRRFLPHADDHDDEQDQDEHHHGADGEDQNGQYQLLPSLPIVRSMDAATAKIHIRSRADQIGGELRAGLVG